MTTQNPYERQRAIMEGERNDSLAAFQQGQPLDLKGQRIYESGFSNGWARASRAVAATEQDALDARRWRWLGNHMRVVWSEGRFTSLVRIVSEKWRDSINSSIDRMMAGDWSDADAQIDVALQAKDDCARSVSDRSSWLNPEDMAALERVSECFEDGEGYDVGAEQMKRMAELGVVRHHSAGRYSITSFGRWVLGSELLRQPLETSAECNARLGAEHRAKLAALEQSA